jgi:hypothetical protein
MTSTRDHVDVGRHARCSCPRGKVEVDDGVTSTATSKVNVQVQVNGKINGNVTGVLADRTVA